MNNMAGNSTVSKTRTQRRIKRFTMQMAVALPGIVMLVFWQLASGHLIRTLYVSKPTDIAVRLYQMFASGEILPDLAVTGQELVISYIVGVTFGLLLGYWLGRSPRAAAIFEPYIMAFYGIPKIALAPLFIIWFTPNREIPEVKGLPALILAAQSGLSADAQARTVRAIRALDAATTTLLSDTKGTSDRIAAKFYPRVAPAIIEASIASLADSLHGGGALTSTNMAQLLHVTAESGGTVPTGNAFWTNAYVEAASKA
jgi:hypothetical protein